MTEQDTFEHLKYRIIRNELGTSKGKLHRDNDLPAVIFASGTKHRYKHIEIMTYLLLCRARVV